MIRTTFADDDWHKKVLLALAGIALLRAIQRQSEIGIASAALTIWRLSQS
jgi:hypothetical protein